MQRYPVDPDFVTTMPELEIRDELFAVFLTASRDERIEFAKKLLPPGYNRLPYQLITMENYDNVIEAFQSYCYKGNIYTIIAFLRDYYLKLPISESAITSGNHGETLKKVINMRGQLPKAGRRRKTKKSKRRQRKTRRRHK